jgi:ATP adenylyltransferase
MSRDPLARLWAPWRSAFVTHAPLRRCIFCAAKRPGADRRHHVVARRSRAFALLNRYPYNNGHLLLAPYRHVGQVEALRGEEWGQVLDLAQQLIRRLRRTLHPDGFNIGANLGRVGGAGIPGHLHLHIVPRWQGDTNFMPILGGAKVISQSLDALYDELTGRRR